MDDELMKALRYLRLRGLLAHWDEYLTLAQRPTIACWSTRSATWK